MNAPASPDQAVAGLRIAITGPGGFIGRASIPALLARGASLTLLQRAEAPAAPQGTRAVALGDLSALASLPEGALEDALAGHDALLHLAGRAHRAISDEAEALALYRAHNAGPTLALARAAARAGVRHMIFVSTSYVHGHVTAKGAAFDSASPLAPSGAYAISKAEAETGLRALAPELGLAVSIIRPAVVHGPNPTANIRALLSAVRRGLPLPLGATRNQRSFLGVDNLNSFFGHVLAHPPAAGETRAYTLADAETPSTAGFIRLLAAAAGRPARLLPVPPELLRLGLRLAGRGGMAESLLDSFRIDISALERDCGWTPPYTLAAGLARMVDADR